MSGFRRVVRGHALASVVMSMVWLGGCAAKGAKVPSGTAQPDKFLFERGTQALNERKWVTAREFFQTLTETYPQSPYRADAKLGVGDSFLGEGTTAAQIFALNEFREFLSFFPTHPRADYAQYKLAMGHYYQMAKPGRDQTETRAAIKEFEAFFERYPTSGLTKEAQAHYREARDRMGESEYGVGLTYYRIKWYPGAVGRFQELLKTDPGFTFRDGVYYYLGESLIKLNRPAEALPLFEKLVSEFEQSEFLEEAQKRIAELKGAMAAGSAPKSARSQACTTGSDVEQPQRRARPSSSSGCSSNSFGSIFAGALRHATTSANVR
jgi:outer membrane protein assembly factor BamD